MEYYEIGEIFEHDGVLLEVVNSPTTNWIDTCCRCYFYNTCTHEDIKCTRSTRKDNRDIVFNRIEASDIREIREKEILGGIDTFFTDRELKILKMIDVSSFLTSELQRIGDITPHSTLPRKKQSLQLSRFTTSSTTPQYSNLSPISWYSISLS